MRSALVVVLLLTPSLGSAQARPTASQLFDTVAGLDSALFGATNACDLTALETLVDEGLEFYHDNDGMTVGRQVFIDSVRNNLCGKVRRELVPGTLKVDRIGDYGAVETGVHRFHHPGRDEVEPVGEGTFLILWRRTSAGWRVTRAVSYFHHAVAAK